MYMYFINNETFSIVVLECQLFYYCYMFGNDTHVHMMCSPQFKILSALHYLANCWTGFNYQNVGSFNPMELKIVPRNKQRVNHYTWMTFGLPVRSFCTAGNILPW